MTRHAVLIIPMLIAILLLACSAPEQATTPKPIKIGLSAPLTGEAASYGEGAMAGAMLAAQEINEAGGIQGRPVELVWEDDNCASQGATAVSRLINVEQVDVIIGPVCSGAAGPAVPIAQAAGVPVILTTASAPGLTKDRDFVFRIYPSDDLQGTAQAAYAYETLGARKAAVIYVQNDWGLGLRDTFKRRFTELGGEIVVDESTVQTSTDFRTALAKIGSSDADILVMELYPGSAVAFMRQYQESGTTLRVLGGDALDATEFYESGLADGVMFTFAKVADTSDFNARAEAASGKRATVTAPFTYDGIKLYAQITGQVGTDKRAVRDALVSATYAGVTSDIAFTEGRELRTAQHGVKRIQDERTEVIA